MKTAPTATFSLAQHGITVAEVFHNLSASTLYQHAITYEKNASIAENGALAREQLLEETLGFMQALRPLNE